MTFADSEPGPDLAIVRGTRSDYRLAHPVSAELVIEVAVSSFEIDLVKAHVYAEGEVPEYWIVCPEKKQVEVFRLLKFPKDTRNTYRFRTHRAGIVRSC